MKWCPMYYSNVEWNRYNIITWIFTHHSQDKGKKSIITKDKNCKEAWKKQKENLSRCAGVTLGQQFSIPVKTTFRRSLEKLTLQQPFCQCNYCCYLWQSLMGGKVLTLQNAFKKFVQKNVEFPKRFAGCFVDSQMITVSSERSPSSK